MKRVFACLQIILLIVGAISCTARDGRYWIGDPLKPGGGDLYVKDLICNMHAQSPDPETLTPIRIIHPYEGAVFPADIASPVCIWRDDVSQASSWLITVKAPAMDTIYLWTRKANWTPPQDLWETVKDHTMVEPATITITGFRGNERRTVVSRGQVRIKTSKDPVIAPIFYRQVPIPFSSNFKKVKWRLGDIASYEKPAVVMENLPICSSCHMFSRDGSKFSMEMNFKNDNGAQFITPVQKHIHLTTSDFMTWSAFPRSSVLSKTRGLFGKMSPTGNYIAASVNEISLALITNDFCFSQVFFPTYGILAIYFSEQRIIRTLPGADNYEYVHANPNWSPDESYIVFARARKKNEVHEDITNVVSRYIDAGIHELNRRYNIQFDLYRIPFNQGRGGVAEPVKGAWQNGMSNYFPRVSPDGKWIVFTQSKTGIMLQPDSQLYIIPAEGGTPRRMKCNRALFNSWHSWSPNNRWLLFSSKVNTPYTEIFLTHIDENGMDSPPVMLSRFSDEKLAANVPEFVNIPANGIQKITVEGY